MNRTEFEALRDLPNKHVRADDIRFLRSEQHRPFFRAEGIVIENDMDVDARMTLTFNPETDSFTINVHVKEAGGAICRLDVNSTPHRPAGRTHKHSLQTERCPQRNIPDGVVDRPDLQALAPEEAFAEFCSMANITVVGEFRIPAE
ncbi:MAG: hypothetical protein AB7K09_02385 [Planctomycetota bacterium]